MPIPFHSPHSLFPIHLYPLTPPSLPLSITPSLTLLPPPLPIRWTLLYKTVSFNNKNWLRAPKITYRTCTRVQREMKIGHMTHRVLNTTVFSFTPVLTVYSFICCISVLNQPGWLHCHFNCDVQPPLAASLFWGLHCNMRIASTCSLYRRVMRTMEGGKEGKRQRQMVLNSKVA